MEIVWIGLAVLFGCLCLWRGERLGKRRAGSAHAGKKGRDRYGEQVHNSGILTGRFREIGTSFRILGEILAKEPGELRQEQEADFWKLRLAESRLAMAEQYLELAGAMDSWEQELACTRDVTTEWKRQLKVRGHKAGIRIKEAFLTENGRQKQACLTIQPENGLINSREIAQAMRGICNSNWRVVPGEQMLLSGKSCRVLLESEPMFRVVFGIARQTKKQETISGDSFSQGWLPRSRAMLALCDGMGSGERAFQESEYALELLERLMDAGYELGTAIRLVHTALLFGQAGERHPVAIDGCVLDLWNGIGRMVKAGGAPSFLWREGTVRCLQAEALPAGVLTGTEPGEMVFHIRSGDVLVMVTDGVLEAIPGKKKEDTFAVRLEECMAAGGQAKALLDRILQDFPGGPDDDMTILTATIGDKNSCRNY